MNKLKKEYITIILPFILFIVLLSRLIYFYNLTESQLIGIVPDDAFYYLKMAQNKAFLGIWSFDGINTSTGFHLLYGYLLYFIFSVFGNIDWKIIFLIIGFLASIFISVSSYLVASTARNLFNKNASLLAISLFFSSLIVFQNTLMMESWLVIFFASSTLFLINQTNNLNKINIVILISCGLLGSLSRTDYGILPGIFFIVYICFYKFNYNNIKIKKIFYILCGAILGVGISFISNALISGNFFQSSAQIKFHWSSIIGHNINPILNIIFVLFKSFNYIIFSIIIIFSLFIMMWKYYSEPTKKIELSIISNDALISTTSCFFVIVSYIIFYRLNSQAIQIWYVSNLIVPISILITGVGVYIYKSNIYIIGLFFLLVFVNDLKENFAAIQWPHQSGMLHAARRLELESTNASAIYAAWNAGIYGYFSNKLVINIDGLTNDEVLPYIKNNQLSYYLKLNNINKIIDYEIMINNQDLQLRGGYLDSKFIKCLEIYSDVNGDYEIFGNSRIKIFNVNNNCQKINN